MDLKPEGPVCLSYPFLICLCVYAVFCCDCYIMGFLVVNFLKQITSRIYKESAHINLV